MVSGIVDHHSDPIGVDRRKSERALHQIVAADNSSRYVSPGGTCPVLHVKVRDAISCKGRSVIHCAAAVEIVLQRVNVDLINRLQHVKVHLYIVGKCGRSAVCPGAAARIIVPVVFTIVNTSCRVTWVVLGRSNRGCAVARQGYVVG